NAANVADSIKNQLEIEYPDYKQMMVEITPYPKTEKMEQFMARLAVQCISAGLRRHAGRIRYIYGPAGRQKIAEGKDLTAVKAIVGTGGILTRSPFADEVLSISRILSKRHVNELLPSDDIKLYRDNHYIFAPIGAISKIDLDTAICLLKSDIKSL
ncbi:MAG TPA: glutamate mutase L, partial [Thermotogota bacterium]|nr:glutamate mutase L [Thermotogota bacterium]